MANNTRNIFEEVGTTEKQVAAPGAIDKGTTGARKQIRAWMIMLFALVALMIAVGGLTRLTDSGLSITEWKPLNGAIPPMSVDAWESEFEKYKQIPEYIEQNQGMTLAEFKVIYWWEWGHRQLGRFIGLVWAIGFGYFYITKKIPTGWTGRMVLLGVLGGLQGAVGWWMVSSGLRPGMLDVASYRLAIHLGLAFVIFGFLTWYILLLSRKEADLMQARRSGNAGLFALTNIVLGFTFFQILLGALVAGIDAGRNYIDWPFMAGEFFPPQPFDLQPVWRNFFEDDGLVQFMHRMAGYVLFLLGVFAMVRMRASANRSIKAAGHGILAMMVVQMIIGIVTVMYSAPWQFAIVHQFGAVVLWVIVLRGRFATRYPLPETIKGTA